LGLGWKPFWGCGELEAGLMEGSEGALWSAVAASPLLAVLTPAAPMAGPDWAAGAAGTSMGAEEVPARLADALSGAAGAELWAAASEQDAAARPSSTVAARSQLPPWAGRAAS